LSISSEQNLRIDTINTLLGKRIKNLKDLYYVKKYYIPEDFYNKTIEKIGTLKDSADIIPDLREKIITVIDSSYIIRERKGLFRTKRDSILKVDTTLHRIVDTLSMVTTNNNTDTLMNVIRDSWSQYQQQKEEIDAEVSRREAIVIQSGQHITERLKRVLKDLEKEELENTMIRLEQQQITTHHLTRTYPGSRSSLVCWWSSSSFLLSMTSRKVNDTGGNWKQQKHTRNGYYITGRNSC
ncbi:MAG: hypothetical protein ACLU4J_23025, partial [Butyricimonas paravirosa]